MDPLLRQNQRTEMVELMALGKVLVGFISERVAFLFLGGVLENILVYRRGQHADRSFCRVLFWVGVVATRSMIHVVLHIQRPRLKSRSFVIKPIPVRDRPCPRINLDLGTMSSI